MSHISTNFSCFCAEQSQQQLRQQSLDRHSIFFAHKFPFSSKAIKVTFDSIEMPAAITQNPFFILSFFHRHIRGFSASSSIPTRSFPSTPKRLWSDIRASNATKFRRMSLPSPTPHIDPCCKVNDSLIAFHRVFFAFVISRLIWSYEKKQESIYECDEAAQNFSPSHSKNHHQISRN